MKHRKSSSKTKRSKVSNKNFTVRLNKSGGELLFNLLQKHGTKKKVSEIIGKSYSTTRRYFAFSEHKDWGQRIPLPMDSLIREKARKRKIKTTFFPSLSFGDILNKEVISLDSLRINPKSHLVHVSSEIQYFKKDGTSFKSFVSKIYYANDGKDEIEKKYREFINALSGKPYIAYIKILSFGIRQYKKGEAFMSKTFIKRVMKPNEVPISHKTKKKSR